MPAHAGIHDFPPQEARKNFFFEKKQQKTFINLGQSWFHQHGPD
jgi:hypothetical protein